MKEKKPITSMWKRAKLATEENNVNKAMPLLETMIIHLSKLTLKGIKEVEGLKVDLWKDRAWLAVETLGMLPEYREEDEKPLGLIMSH